MRWFCIAVLLASLTSCDIQDWGGSGRYREEFREVHAFPSGGRLYLENFNGRVEILGWDRESAEITGTKYAASPEARDALRIDVVASGDSIRIRTVRPSDRRGNMGASYVIQVPRRTSLERIQTSNGRVRVSGIEGAARLITSNGAIQVEGLDGGLEAKTSNGSIKATLGRLEARMPLRLSTSNGSVELTVDELRDNPVDVSTSNGSITVRLPQDIAAELRARTSNGSVNSEFEVATTGSTSRTRLDGAIRGGGPLVDLRTSNGAIRLLKRG